MIADKIEALLADKGYDADAVREELTKAGIEAVIPAKRNRKNPAPHDAEKYKWRNLIERLFSKLKNWRRVATRYDKSKESCSALSQSLQSSSGYPLSTKPCQKRSSFVGSDQSFYGFMLAVTYGSHFSKNFGRLLLEACVQAPI